MGTNQTIVRVRAWVLPAALLLAWGCDSGGPPAADDAGDPPCELDIECANGVFCDGQEACVGGVCTPGPAPCEGECDELAEACVSGCGAAGDADGDGVDSFECGGTDCDDEDPARYPGNTEVCDPDGRDEDCDPTTFGFRDQDGDGFPDAACCNGETCGTDCDDLNALVHPSEAESCDGFDNDCNGDIDDGLAIFEYWPDCDRDDAGDRLASPVLGCAPPAAAPAECPSGQFATAGGDCDDGRASVGPGALEVCNGWDDDCNGVVDDRVDSAGAPLPCSCDVPGETRTCGTDEGVCTVGTQTCSGGAWTVCDGVAPAEFETCDLADEDCDGVVDEEAVDRDTLYPDRDGDGFGDSAMPLFSCPRTGYISRAGDCRDADPASDPRAGAVNPAETEVCYDGIDNNCDPSDDDTGCDCPALGATTSCGFGPGEAYESCDGGPCATGAPATCRAGSRTCEVGGRWGACEGLAGPGLDGPPSSCNGFDDDCDGSVDEGCGCTSGTTRACGSDVGTCSEGTQNCVGGSWETACSGTPPQSETCDGLDNDCDGTVDNGCPCVVGQFLDCGTDEGRCMMGERECRATSGGASSAWGSCEGDVPSRPEVSPSVGRGCNSLDDDCDGRIDEAPMCDDEFLAGDFTTAHFAYNGAATGTVVASVSNSGSIMTPTPHFATAITDIDATFALPGSSAAGGARGEVGVGWFHGTAGDDLFGSPAADGLFAVVDQTDAQRLLLYMRLGGAETQLATRTLSAACSVAGDYRLRLQDDDLMVRATLTRDGMACGTVAHSFDSTERGSLVGGAGARETVHYGVFSDGTDNSSYPYVRVERLRIVREALVHYGPCDGCLR